MRVGLDARLVARGLGIAHVVQGLSRQLVDEVDVVWFGPEDTAPDGVADCVTMRGFPYAALDSPIGWTLARRANLDVMHFTGNTGWTRRQTIPTVLNVHDTIFFRRAAASTLRQHAGRAYLRHISPYAARSATVVVSGSQASATDVARVLRLDRPPVVIPNGVDRVAAASTAPDTPPYVVAMSANDPRKGVAAAIAGWHAVRDEGIALKLLVGGGLPDALSHLTSAPPAGMELIPYLPRRELERLVAGAQAFIYPSEEEGFGLPVLEAMALGTPVITGIAPATRELGGSAVLQIDRVDVPGSIASWVKRLLHEPSLRERSGDAGLQRASEYTWRNLARKYIEQYERAIVTAGASDRL